MSIYERPDWTALRSEGAIDARQPIIDAHHHLWDRDDSTYLAPELRTAVESSHNITRTVFVECSAGYDAGASAELAPVGETRFVAEQAAAMAHAGWDVISQGAESIDQIIEHTLDAMEATGTTA